MLCRWLLLMALAAPELTTAALPCRTVENLKPLLVPGTILMLGEIHGTMESPAFALDVACHAARTGLQVVVALELSPAEQSRIDTFLISPGAEDDQQALLAGRPWQSGYQDGRASRAMFELLDGIRRLREAGSAAAVVLFDASGNRGGQQRDRDMAHTLAAALQRSPAALAIVLTGNLHSRLTPGVSWNADYEPMGYLLVGRLPDRNLVSLDVAHGGGSAWICNPDCGVRELQGRHGTSEGVIELDEDTRPAGHRGWYHVGTLTASPPAIRSGAAPLPAGSSLPPGASRTDPTPASPTGTMKDASSSGSATPPTPPTGPLSPEELKFQGTWQAYDVDSEFKLWGFEFGHRTFFAQAGEDDWYRGKIAIQADSDPPQLDFTIEDCLCAYKGMTSQAIYRWDGDKLVVSASTPGRRRPLRFSQASGQMMRLLRTDP